MELKGNSIDWKLTSTDTLALKGIAICGMLCWHLFYCPNPVGESFSFLTKWFGIMGDVCVSAFLFASGYGLSIQFAKYTPANRGGRSWKFIIRRLIKFYANFWIILLLMLPIGIFGFHRPLTESNSLMTILMAWLREIFAISGHSSYNASWWFNALIIELYLLFPILYYGLKHACIPTLLFVFLQRHLSIAHIGMDMQIYLPIFVIGMLWAMYGESITQWMHRVPKWLCGFLIVVLLLMPAVLLPYMDDGYSIFYRGIKLYWLLTIALSFCIILLRSYRGHLGKSLVFLGKHSSNIYLMHTLIFFYWFPQFFYGLHNPFLIFVTLMGICLLLSVGIEWIKDKSLYNQLVNKTLKILE